MNISSRFKVIDRQTGKELKDVFVLTPETSEAARIALAAYAEASRGKGVRGRLLVWLDELRKKDSKASSVSDSKVIAGPPQAPPLYEGLTSAGNQ